jgi:hypothetical protein
MPPGPYPPPSFYIHIDISLTCASLFHVVTFLWALRLKLWIHLSPSCVLHAPPISPLIWASYYIYCHVKWVPCHHGTARPRVAYRGDGLQIWRVAANILNKQSRTADSGWSSSRGVWRGANNPHPTVKKKQFVTNHLTQPWNWTDSLARPKHQKMEWPVAGSCECSDKLSGSSAMELVNI